MRRLLALGAGCMALLLLGAGCIPGSSSGTSETKPITLDYWRVIDGEDAFDQIITAYQQQHPSVHINYRKLRLEEYEDELVRALAAGTGPDIFTVHNTKLREYTDLIAPMPAKAIIPTAVTQGTLRKEVVIQPREKVMPSLRKINESFVDVALEDAVITQNDQQQLYGIPLAVDTLALYTNRDLLNAAGIAEPPKTWTDFQDAVRKLTKIESGSGRVIQSGVGMGTAENVERSTDILSILMLQNGVPMVNDRGQVTFSAPTPGGATEVPPALGAVAFYTDFANPTKEVYTWNNTFPDSFEAFANGQTAMFLGYSYHAPLLRAASPRLRFDISPLPQIGSGRVVNYANYWLEVVSKKADDVGVAWDFLNFASSAEQVGSYLERAEKPTALKALINGQLENEKVGVFAGQLLTATSWYRGKDADAAESALRELITNVVTGAVEPEDALNFAARVLAQTY